MDLLCDFPMPRHQ